MTCKHPNAVRHEEFRRYACPDCGQVCPDNTAVWEDVVERFAPEPPSCPSCPPPPEHCPVCEGVGICDVYDWTKPNGGGA